MKEMGQRWLLVPTKITAVKSVPLKALADLNMSLGSILNNYIK